MTNLTRTTALALLLGLSLTACGDDPPTVTPDAPMNPDAGPTGRTYRQVEHLARPGINEALLISDAFLNGYNATAPSFAGVDQATLGMVVDEAKTVLKALYLGVCLLNGTLTNDPNMGLKPAGITCHAVGPAIWEGGQLNGTVLTAASKAAAQTYADAVFGLFIPDVMRIDTSIATSNYLNLCGAGGKQGLCGGRFLNDDTIDVTYNFLLSGAMVGKGPFNQLRALVTDGVNFSLNDAQNSSNFVLPDPNINNPQQGHPNVSQAFPYSAPPL